MKDKKKIYALITLIILIVVLFMVSCGITKDDKKKDKDLIDKQNKIITSFGKTTDEKIVIKLLKANNDKYYVYYVENTKFTLYCYEFYETKEAYDKALDKYASGIYQLEKDDNALMTKVYAQSGYKSENKDLYEEIMEQYSDTKKYEIIK